MKRIPAFTVANNTLYAAFQITDLPLDVLADKSITVIQYNHTRTPYIAVADVLKWHAEANKNRGIIQLFNVTLKAFEAGRVPFCLLEVAA